MQVNGSIFTREPMLVSGRIEGLADYPVISNSCRPCNHGIWPDSGSFTYLYRALDDSIAAYVSLA